MPGHPASYPYYFDYYSSNHFCFFPLLLDRSDIDLRHSLANLVAVVLGCPVQPNYLWYHLFDPAELHGTYMAGFMVGDWEIIVLDGLRRIELIAFNQCL